MYIDVNDFAVNEEYKSTLHNKKMGFILQKNEFIVYADQQESQRIKISKQKTGFGYKKFFVCPNCSKRRKHLYLIDGACLFVCRSCLNKNIYSNRCNMYDENIGNIAMYKAFKILKELQVDTSDMLSFRSMVDYIPGPSKKPKCMRWKRYELLVKQLYMLHFIWDCSIMKKLHMKPYMDIESITGAKDINDMLEETNVDFAYEMFLSNHYFRI